MTYQVVFVPKHIQTFTIELSHHKTDESDVCPPVDMYAGSENIFMCHSKGQLQTMYFLISFWRDLI